MKKFALTMVMVCACMSMFAAPKNKQKTDREVWVDIMYQMAEPVMRNMAETAAGDGHRRWLHQSGAFSYMG